MDADRERSRAPRRYREFREWVLQARAQARVEAERWAYENAKEFWLLAGPGKPEWSRSSAVAVTQADTLKVIIEYAGDPGDPYMERLAEGTANDTRPKHN